MISKESKGAISEHIKNVASEISNLDRELAPLLAQKKIIDDQIQAIIGRKSDLESNKVNLSKDID